MTAAPRNLVLLATGLSHGGAETQLVRLAQGLKARGWQVRIISMMPPHAFTEELAAAGIPVVSLHMERGKPSPGAFFKAVHLLRQWRPEVLTCFMYHANLLGRLAGRLAGVPVIITSIRNGYFGGGIRNRLERLTEGLSTVTTTNSALAANELVRCGAISGKRIRVIPNGLDMSVYTTPVDRTALRCRLGVAEDDFLWLAVARLEEAKDYPNLLHAFAKVTQENPQAKLKIAGQGPLLLQLQQLTADLKLQDRVEYLGLRDDVPLLLRAADGFVLASAWEGSPNAVLEALAAARPAVATEVGGVAELVQDGSSGFLVPPRDPQQLAEAMMQLMALPEETRCKMGKAGRAHVTAHYSVDHVFDMWEALFLEHMRLVEHRWGQRVPR